DEYNGISKIWERKGVKKFSFEDIKITEGNRVGGGKQHFKLAFKCIDHGKSYEEFRELSFKCNAGSKDLTAVANSSDVQKDRVCRSVWNSANKYREQKSSNPKYQKAPQSSSGFISNISLLTDEDEKRISESIDKMGVLRFDRKRRLTLIAREFVGKHNYECHNPRSISPKAKLKKPTKESLKHGVQFPLEYVKRLKDHHNIKGDIRMLRSEVYNKCGIFNKVGGYFRNSNGSSCQRFKLTYLNDYNNGNPYMDPRIDPITMVNNEEGEKNE
ncbi:hypothetical protein ACE5IX_19860, partial [Leptospira wolffii]